MSDEQGQKKPQLKPSACVIAIRSKCGQCGKPMITDHFLFCGDCLEKELKELREQS